MLHSQARGIYDVIDDVAEAGESVDKSKNAEVEGVVVTSKIGYHGPFT